MCRTTQEQLDAFRIYPEIAGSQPVDTSEAAAESIEKTGRAELLRTKVLIVLRSAGTDLTADMIAERLGESVLSIRPRVTELFKHRKIVFSGNKYRNISGKLARAFRIAEGK